MLMLLSDNPFIEIEAGDVDESTAKEVYRNLQVLYNTVAGEQGLDRDFGIDNTIQDRPQEHAQSLLAAEYIRKTNMYEPRAEVIRVDWVPGKENDGIMRPKVVIKIV